MEWLTSEVQTWQLLVFIGVFVTWVAMDVKWGFGIEKKIETFAVKLESKANSSGIYQYCGDLDKRIYRLEDKQIPRWKRWLRKRLCTK